MQLQYLLFTDDLGHSRAVSLRVRPCATHSVAAVHAVHDEAVRCADCVVSGGHHCGRRGAAGTVSVCFHNNVENISINTNTQPVSQNTCPISSNYKVLAQCAANVCIYGSKSVPAPPQGTCVAEIDPFGQKKPAWHSWAVGLQPPAQQSVLQVASFSPVLLPYTPA